MHKNANFSFEDVALVSIEAVEAPIVVTSDEVDERLRPVPRAFLDRVAKAAVDAGRQTAGIAAIIVCAGLIVGVLNQTGLGVK
ncbi:MAG: hypothetical protein RLN74_02475, partial [Ilumatobacter fluminis]